MVSHIFGLFYNTFIDEKQRRTMKPEEKAILKAELKGPNAAKYTGKSHEQIADSFREQVPDTEDEKSIPSSTLIAALLTNSEYATLSESIKADLRMVVSAGDISIDLRGWLRNLFPADKSPTKRDINKAFRRAGTYAESLKIPLPTNNDIADILERGQ